jgi:hypothetical protein
MKIALLEEVTNIRTTYLRAGLIDEPISSDTKKLLVDYVDQRVTVAFEYCIPFAIFYVLYVILFFSMFVLGYQFGISGKGNFKINVLMAIVFAVVMFLITALDRPEIGLAKINQKPMNTLQNHLHGKQVR